MNARTLIAAAVLTLGAAGPASAATLAVDGQTLIYTAEDGERNTPLFNEARTGSLDDFIVLDDAHITAIPAGCEYTVDDTYVTCHLPGITVAKLTLGDGDDTAGAFSEWGARTFEVDAGPGDDHISAPSADGSASFVNAGEGDDTLDGTDGPDAFDGGPGRDKIDGAKGDDLLGGGDGDDTVDGGAGADVVAGGTGDDLIYGDHFEGTWADLIDGGPGYDTLESDYTTRDPDDHEPPVAITLAGGADDGRPGENDEVVAVEDLTTHVESTLTGTDGPERLVVFQVLKPSTLKGLGGDDDLKTSGGNDTVEGGGGNDTIDAGYGDDKITGGPGQDAIFADLRGGDCSPLWCTVPYGNDTVDARDGEADSVTCGAGQDSVTADPQDTVAPDCETVDRGSGGPGVPAGGGGSVVTPSGKACVVPKVTGLKVGKAKRRIAKAGCKAKVRGRGKRVRRQSVKAGRQLPLGTTVRLRRGR